MDETIKKILNEIDVAMQTLSAATSELNRYVSEKKKESMSLKELAENLQTLRLS